MPSSRLLSCSIACGVALLTLAACSDSAIPANTFAMAEVKRFDQPPPSKPLWNDPIVTLHDVLPKPAADSPQPLPAAVALPVAAASAAAAIPDAGPATPGSPPQVSASPENKDGGVNPAAGQAAAITDSQGAQHSQGAK